MIHKNNLIYVYCSVITSVWQSRGKEFMEGVFRCCDYYKREIRMYQMCGGASFHVQKSHYLCSADFMINPGYKWLVWPRVSQTIDTAN